MSSKLDEFLARHAELTRRYFLRLGAVGAGAMGVGACGAFNPIRAAEPGDVLDKAVAQLDFWLTRPEDFQDVSRGKPVPHSLDEAKRKDVGLTRESWRLEVVSDSENPARLRNPLTREKNSALTFADLMQLAGQHAVRFPKVMTCLNIGCPLGNGIWEGVPLREVLWLTQPSQDLRRVHYYGYHNDDPQQMFRSSLPVGRVLEDLYGLPPVILCYKLNGQWLTPERGAPVRIVVPEAYGFKSIKWLSHVVLSNRWNANDTYGEKNNDVDSPLKTFCATLNAPKVVRAETPFAVTGWAQVGVSGLSKVQAWVQSAEDSWPTDDRYFTKAPWRDTQLLGPPESWGGGLPEDRIPLPTAGFDPETGRPLQWPLPLTKVHWAILHPGLPAGEYTLRSRTIDARGIPQPMPRPFRKSGHAAIEEIALSVV